MHKLFLHHTKPEEYDHAIHFPKRKKGSNVQVNRDISFQQQNPKTILSATCNPILHVPILASSVPGGTTADSDSKSQD
jgi:hypothetical protein